MKIVDNIWNNKEKILLYSLILVAAVVITGVFLFPRIFYDNWIWKYYWGPVVADSFNSGGTTVFNGVAASEGYTMVSELTYGVILIIALYYIYRLLKKLKITVDWRFALALMPFILFGPVTRVLEDTGYFQEPLVYWFISPFIYMMIAFFVILFLFIGRYLEDKINSSKITVNRVLFVGGLFVLIPFLIPIVSWILGARWDSTTGINFDIFLIVVGIVSLIVFLVYFIANYFKENKKIVVYKNPLNLAMLCGHMIDGIATYISIKDPFFMGLSYAEKHPASNFLLDIWGPLFPIVKFLLIIFVIYVFDVLYKEELEEHKTLVNLLKIGILILGFAPGLRNLLRVTMGV
jgi:uncharacterized membrane protein